jgi:predicted ATP-dependent protease
MLRQDVIDAVDEGRFHIHAVRTIDEGIALLTGMSAGKPDDFGSYPEDTINGKVQRRLAQFAEKRQRFARQAKEYRA